MSAKLPGAERPTSGRLAARWNAERAAATCRGCARFFDSASACSAAATAASASGDGLSPSPQLAVSARRSASATCSAPAATASCSASARPPAAKDGFQQVSYGIIEP